MEGMGKVSRRSAVAFLLNAPLVLAGCVAQSQVEQANPIAPTFEVPPEATAIPTATAVPPPPPTATPVPPRVEVRPAEIPQGGTATVILNIPAASGTVSFQGRQYPLASSGDRRWAIIGTGAFTRPGAVPVTVTFTLPGQTQASEAVSVQVTDAAYPLERITLDPKTAALLAPDIIQAELAQRAAIYGNFTTERLWTGPFLRPSTAAIGDIYGMARSYNGAPATDYHRGTDFTGQTGEPVVASAAGRVVYAGELKVRGNSVIVDHGLGIFTAYHHFSRMDLAHGAVVSPGQQLGLIGSTGLVTGPHLHWEVVVRGVEVDGRAWLRGSDFAI
jgi:murein DD-endopeptidase MepM/ murein hydrolase activator NlpD